MGRTVSKIKTELLSPIILFVYNRPQHTLQTLEALANNELADQSILYIYADGAKENADENTLKQIEETRDIIKRKQWCKEVHIIEAKRNKGLADSIINGVTDIVNKYGKAIVLEDDIVTSKDFLEYMNSGLILYEEEKQVKSITAYVEPILTTSDTPFFLSKGSSWGWGTWKRVWSEIIWDTQVLINSFDTDDKINQLNFSNYPYFEMLKDQLKGNIDSWAIRFYASCCLQQGLHLTPPWSLVYNAGFDGSGTHCDEKQEILNTTKFCTKLISYNKVNIVADTKIPILIEELRNRNNIQYQKKGLFWRIVNKLKSFIK